MVTLKCVATVQPGESSRVYSLSSPTDVRDGVIDEFQKVKSNSQY